MDEGAPTLGDLALVEDSDFGEVMRCVFGLQRHETETYLALRERPGVSAATLATHLERDRSNVSRSLGPLREKDLVERRREVLDGGGQVYCYHPAALGEVKARMHAALEEWVATVHDQVEAFGDGPSDPE